MATPNPRIHLIPGALLLASLCLAVVSTLRAQQAAPAISNRDSSVEFSEAADEVLGKMSEITGLELRIPLKRSLRSRDEIRAYVIKQMNEDKNAAERYASGRVAEAFGLIPKGFDLDSFMVDLLTEQIAGLYDPKAHEFYIADWIPLADQRMVMAHELTHALEDQHFQIEAWLKAARPNDDAELARDAVLEGSAMAAMVDYLLRGTGRSLQDLPDIEPSALVGDLAGAPVLQKAPPFLKDSLVFPYFSGLKFTAAMMKPAGWSALPGVFAKPPVSSQQILHPAAYRASKVPASVALPALGKRLGPDWKKLEENTLGEFGWEEVLKEFLGEERATPLSSAWEGDRYLVCEETQTKRLLVVTLLRLSSEEQAVRFFGQYSEALEKKHEERINLFRRPNFFSCDTPDGGVFLRCVATECVTLEGGDPALFAELNRELSWSSVPEPPKKVRQAPERIAGNLAPTPANARQAAMAVGP